jgi:hypothetical protein
MWNEPYNFTGKSVPYVCSNPKFCIHEVNNYYWVTDVIILPTVLTVIFFLLVFRYVYRYEVTYVCHLVKITKKRWLSEPKISDDFQLDALFCYKYCNNSVRLLYFHKKLTPRIFTLLAIMVSHAKILVNIKLVYILSCDKTVSIIDSFMFYTLNGFLST